MSGARSSGLFLDLGQHLLGDAHLGGEREEADDRRQKGAQRPREQASREAPGGEGGDEGDGWEAEGDPGCPDVARLLAEAVAEAARGDGLYQGEADDRAGPKTKI